MELKQMLEYQAQDREVFKLENELRQSEEIKQANKLQTAYKQTQDVIVGLNSRAKQRMEAVARLEERYSRSLHELEELEAESDNIGDLKEAEFYDKRLGDITKALEALEKEMIAAGDELKRVTAAVTSEQQRLQQYREKYIKARQSYELLKKKIQERALPYAGKMKQLEKEIDPALMERYKRVRGNRKMPVLVPFTESGGCGGCMMELSENEKGKLAANGICECPNCGRLVYKA